MRVLSGGSGLWRKKPTMALSHGGVSDGRLRTSANRGSGAVPLLDAPLSLMLPLKTIEAALQAAKKL
jgi:hypothetical protein